MKNFAAVQQKSKIRLRDSLYGKVAITTVLVFTLVGVGQLYFIVSSVLSLIGNVNQKLYWKLAPNIVNAIQPLVIDSFERIEVQREFHRWALMNPSVDFYLINSKGKILAHTTPGIKHDTVPLEPITRSLSPTLPEFPIYGQDPSDKKDKYTVFSAAPILITDDPGYVYLILNGGWQNHLLQREGLFFLLHSLVGGWIVIGLFGIFLGFLVYSYLSRRFRELTGIVREYENNNFSQRVEISIRDEIGEFSTAINTMADTIVANSKALEAKDSERRELVANISHDLLTPITAAKGFLETIKRNQHTLSEEKRERYWSIIYSSIESQELLVNDLFELSKLDANDRELSIEPFSVDELIEDTVTSFQTAAEKKEISLTTEIPEVVPFAKGDIVLIARVLRNLISNSIHYTPKGGKVVVRTREVAGHLETEVADTGRGIPEEDLPHLFETFYRVEKDRAKETGGSGLGLAIVKRIIERHNADIRIESTLGVGTQVYFTLELDKRN